MVRKNSKKWFPYFSGACLLLLVVSTAYMLSYDKSLIHARQISGHTNRIAMILKRIDETCQILSVKSGQRYIDFLTVREFVGSEIGPFNLAHPQHWNGPYIQDNPMFDGRLYEVVQAEDGYYVVPGDGALLPGRRIMGKDIVITRHTNMKQLLTKGGPLFYKGNALASKLDFVIGDWDYTRLDHKKLERLGKAFKEISEALPYSYNDRAPSAQHAL